MTFRERSGFNLMNDHLVISGKVVQGGQKAAFFTGLDWVKAQCYEKLGFIPFPGTLNLELDYSSVDTVKDLDNAAWKDLVPPDDNFCQSQILPVSANGLKCAMIRPDSKANIHNKQIIELLAPVKLRDTLGLIDGDMVQVCLLEEQPSSGKKIHISAALFDLDGTLIDSVDSYYRIVEIALEKLQFPPVPRSTILEAARTDQFNWDMVLPKVPGQSREETTEKAWQLIQEIYPDIFLKNVKPFPGTVHVLKFLRKNNIRIGVVTSTPEKNISDKMKLLDIDNVSGMIETVISAGDVTRKKPYPDPLILCMERMALSPDQCVYVGDMKIDIAAGKAAGMKTIGVLTGFESFEDLSQEAPDIIIDSISDMPFVLEI